MNDQESYEELQRKLDRVRELSKNLKHGKDCFKSRFYKDDIECRCSLLELRKLLDG